MLGVRRGRLRRGREDISLKAWNNAVFILVSFRLFRVTLTCCAGLLEGGRWD